MEQLNNKIKDIYNQEHTPLPDEFKWDEMKEGIFEKMENQEDEPAPVLTFSNGLKFLLVALVLIFSSASVYFFVNNFEKKRTSSSIKDNQIYPLKNKSTISNSIKNESKLKLENESTLNQNNSVNKNEPIFNSIPPKNRIANDYSNKKTAKNNKLIHLKAAKKQIGSSVKNIAKPERSSEVRKMSSGSNYLFVNHKNAEPAIDKISVDNKNNVNQRGYKNKINHSKSKVEKFAKTTIEKKNEAQPAEPLIMKDADLINEETEEKIKQVVYVPIIEKPAENNFTSNAIKLHGGLTYMKSPFKKTDEAQFKSETGFMANYVSASYNRTFANGFYLSLGTTYSRLKSKFELYDIIIHSYLVENAETRRVRNILTGRVIRTAQGNVQVSALSSRKVRHYNKFDTWSVPFIVGKQWRHKLFCWHVGIGSDVSLYNWSEGKTLRKDKVITYSKSGTDLYHTSLRVATLTEVGLGISINSHLEIITNFRYKKHLRNWSADDLVVKPHVFLMGTGVKFKF